MLIISISPQALTFFNQKVDSLWYQSFLTIWNLLSYSGELKLDPQRILKNDEQPYFWARSSLKPGELHTIIAFEFFEEDRRGFSEQNGHHSWWSKKGLERNLKTLLQTRFVFEQERNW